MFNKLKKLFSYYKPYKFLFFSDMFFAIIGAAVVLIIPLIVRYITNEVVYFEAKGAMDAIVMLGGLMLGLVLVEFGCNFYIAYFGHVMGAKMEADMRSDIFGHYQKLTFAFYDNQKVGHLLSRITSDLFDISELLHHGPEDLVISIIKIVGSFLILMTVNVKLALIAFAFIPAMLVFALYYNRKMKSAFRRNRAKIADINSQIEDSLSGIRVVKSFANEEVEMEKFCTGNSHFVKAKRKSYLYMGAYYSGLNAMSSLITVVVLLTGFQLITTKAVNVSDLITFLLYINNFIEPVKKLVNFTEQFQNGYSGFERFLEVMEIAPDIQDDKDAVSVNELKGKIQFQDVSFHYEDHKDKVLNHIDLNVEAGEYMALVGPSGVGKTTLCSLIPRFYEVSDGAITIDGIDIRHMKLED
ncbi:MAG: ABC transporter ATP-binding protein, partial [Lachnospiraceae bacterium]